MKKIRLFLIFFSLLFLSSCSPITRSSGEIADISGNLLENVKVKISGKSLKQSENLEFITKSDGRFDFGELKVSAELPIELKLTVSKEGYKTITKEIKFGEDNKDKIILEAENKL